MQAARPREDKQDTKTWFKCSCGNQIFTIKNNAVYCTSCGEIYTFDYLRLKRY